MIPTRPTAKPPSRIRFRFGAAGSEGGMAGSTTMTGGMSLLGAFAWAYYQEAKDAYNTCLDVGGEIYIRTEYVNTATGDSLVPLRDVLAHYQGGRLEVGELDFRANLRDLRSDIVQLMFSGGVAWLQQEADLGFLKEVSNIPTGFQGYNGANLPPVLVYVMMWGPLQEAADKDHYPTTLAASLGYTLDFGPISQSFPGDRLPQDLGDEQRAEGSLEKSSHQRIQFHHRWRWYRHDPDDARQ